MLSTDRKAYRITDLRLVHEEGGTIVVFLYLYPSIPRAILQRCLPCLIPTNQHHHSGKPLPIADPRHVALELAKTRTQYPNKDTPPPLSRHHQPKATWAAITNTWHTRLTSKLLLCRPVKHSNLQVTSTGISVVCGSLCRCHKKFIICKNIHWQRQLSTECMNKCRDARGGSGGWGWDC